MLRSTKNSWGGWKQLRKLPSSFAPRSVPAPAPLVPRTAFSVSRALESLESVRAMHARFLADIPVCHLVKLIFDNMTSDFYSGRRSPNTAIRLFGCSDSITSQFICCFSFLTESSGTEF